MFKGKLIKNKSFYKYTTLSYWLGTIFSVLFAVYFSNMLPLRDISKWSWIHFLVIFLIICIGLFSKKINQKIDQLTSNKIVLDASNIKIISSSGKKEQNLDLREGCTIHIPKKLASLHFQPYDLIPDTAGKRAINQISIFQEDSSHTFSFMIDSHYMADQLKKVLALWESKGYKLIEV